MLEYLSRFFSFLKKKKSNSKHLKRVVFVLNLVHFSVCVCVVLVLNVKVYKQKR